MRRCAGAPVLQPVIIMVLNTLAYYLQIAARHFLYLFPYCRPAFCIQPFALFIQVKPFAVQMHQGAAVFKRFRMLVYAGGHGLQLPV